VDYNPICAKVPGTYQSHLEVGSGSEKPPFQALSSQGARHLTSF
jgi:hypothetical protein